MAGLDNMGGSDAGRINWANTLGTSGGEQNHTQTTSEMPVHSHGVNDPSHTHPNSTPTTPLPAGGATNSYWYSTLTGNTGAAFTGITIQNAGSGTPFNVMQPTILFNTIIKYAP